MSDHPGKLNRFWQELKRRKVFRVMAMYAATGFIIMEAADIMLPRLGLPDWTVTFLIVLIIAGFPVTLILSWIFDLTPEGVRKTEAISEMGEKEESDSDSQTLASGNKFFKLSNVLIVILLIVVCILLYPRIFKQDQLKELRDEGGMISVAVLPFDNLTGDSALYFWQNGISEYLINGLATSPELAVSSSQVISDVLEGDRQVNLASLSPDMALRTAQKINASTHITGNFIGREQDMSIMLNLVNTQDGEVIWSTRVEGNLNSSYREVLDRLSYEVRNHMEIRALEDRVESDLTNAYPNSAEAYRHYIDGLKAIVEGNYDFAIESLLSAYETDTTFTFAAFYLALAHNFSGRSDLNSETSRWTIRAHELKDKLPPAYRPWIEIWYACFVSKNEGDIRRYCDQMFEAAVNSRFLLYDLGITYADFLGNYDKSIIVFEKLDALNRQWEDDWQYDMYYLNYAFSLLMANRPEEVERIVDMGLKINPDKGRLHMAKGAKSIMLDDSVGIQNAIKKIKELGKRGGYSESQILNGLGTMYCWAKDSLAAIKYFRQSFQMDPKHQGSLALLIECQLRTNTNIQECHVLLTNALKVYPNEIAPRWGMGVTLHKLGRHQEALDMLISAEEETKHYNRRLNQDIEEVERAIAQSSGL